MLLTNGKTIPSSYLCSWPIRQIWRRVSAKIKDSKIKHLDQEGAKTKPVIFLQPMSRWHLFQEFKNGVNTGGRIEYVWLFGIIGMFVLLLACINFMNLSTARSEKEGKRSWYP